MTAEKTRSVSTLVRRTGAALVAAGLAAAPGSPARAQVTSESFLRNHGTLPSYQTTYTPGTGQDRIVVVIVASEYDLNRQENGASVPNESVASSVTLGGVPLRSFAPSAGLVGAPPTSRENARNKRNRLSLFYLPEAELPVGASTFSIAYTQPASSMIYIATALNIRQDDPISAPVFDVNCRGRVWQSGNSRRGPIAFAPIAVAPSDKVLSWVVTGDSDARTTFRNGGTEFLDERRTSPGFSLAGAIQSPQAAVTVGGDAVVSDGCANRPLTMQFLLRSKGADGTVAAPTLARLGAPYTIRVADADLDLRDSVVDTVTVEALNPRTGQAVTVTLTETTAGSGVFEGDLPTVKGAGAGATMGALREDEIVVTYNDALSTTGPGQVRTARTTLLDGPRLRANKSVSVVGGGQAVPGADILYRIEVANDGFGPTNADSVFFLDPLPPLDFLVGDPVTGDGDVAPVRFTQAGAGLVYDYAADVRFAGPGPAPTGFADCPLSPAPGYTAGLGYLCVRPRGSMDAGDPDPRFTLTFRMRIP